jgi:hypothetical protein
LYTSALNGEEWSVLAVLHPWVKPKVGLDMVAKRKSLLGIDQPVASRLTQYIYMTAFKPLSSLWLSQLVISRFLLQAKLNNVLRADDT